jgi:carboxylate-amine ligase
MLAGYAQLLARWLLAERPIEIDDNYYMLYQYNRFEASRFGLHGALALPPSRDAHRRASRMPIQLDILERLQDLQRYAQNEVDQFVLRRLSRMTYERVNDAAWLRQTFEERGSLNEMTRLAATLWMEETASPFFR